MFTNYRWFASVGDDTEPTRKETTMTMKWIKQPHAGNAWDSLGYVVLDSGQQLSVEAEDDTVVTGTNRGNEPMLVTWTTVRTLLLEENDDDIEFVYGCADCWYAALSPRSIFPHRNAHITPEERAARRAAKEAKKAAKSVKPVAPVAAPVPVERTYQSASSTLVERRRRRAATAPAPLSTPASLSATRENGSTPAVTGLSDAMDALRLLVAQAESVPALEKQLAETSLRASAAEAELAEYRQLARKLMGS